MALQVVTVIGQLQRILIALLAGLRAEELRQADVGDIRTTDDGSAVIYVKGKGGKERSVPIEAELLSVIETYLDSRAIRFPGALVHGLRHTYATELAGSEVSVYTLMKLLGHESMTTSQRYASAAGTETRSAAARNGLYTLIPDGVSMRIVSHGSTAIFSASPGSIPVSCTSIAPVQSMYLDALRKMSRRFQDNRFHATHN